MKAIKIILVLIVIGTIAFFVWRSMSTVILTPKVPQPKDELILRIEREIDSLSKSADTVFCQELYQNIQYHIADYHQQVLLGKNERDNNQWKEILSKNLYSAYAPKFVAQAMHVMNGTDWSIADLKIIRSELAALKSSAYLDAGSIVASKFQIIDAAVKKYFEITNFIASSNSFSYSSYGINDNFPDTRDKIEVSRTLLENNLYDPYVNKCTRLKEGLRNVPQKLFVSHWNYLDNKIRRYSGKYTAYNDLDTYSKEIYTPLASQIEAFENGIYGINDQNSGRLKSSLDADYRNAYRHFH